MILRAVLLVFLLGTVLPAQAPADSVREGPAPWPMGGLIGTEAGERSVALSAGLRASPAQRPVAPYAGVEIEEILGEDRRPVRVLALMGGVVLRAQLLLEVRWERWTGSPPSWGLRVGYILPLRCRCHSNHGLVMG